MEDIHKTNHAEIKEQAKKRKPRKSWKKPPGKPKRPLSAYNLFFRVEREKMLAAKGTKSLCFEGMTKTVAKRWNDLDAESRQPFIEAAKVEKKVYENAVIAWKEQHERKRMKTKPLRSSRPMSLRKMSHNSIARPPTVPVQKQPPFFVGGPLPCQSRPPYYVGGPQPSQNAPPAPPRFYYGVPAQNGNRPPIQFQQDNKYLAHEPTSLIDAMPPPIYSMERAANISTPVTGQSSVPSSSVRIQDVNISLDIFSDPEFVSDFLSFDWS